MRVLLCFACSFAVAVLLAVYALPTMTALLLAAILLIASVVLCVRRKQIGVLLLGIACGLLWTQGYETFVVNPAVKLAGQVVEITGVATDYSAETAYGIQVPARITSGDETVKAMVWLYSDVKLKPGDRFSVLASLEDPTDDGNYYYRAEGIQLTAYGKTTPELVLAEQVPLRYFPRWIAHKLELSLQKCVPEDALGYALALTTGNRELLSTLEQENLRISGIYHVLALSGMHMTVLVGTLSLLIRNKRTKALVGIPLCIAFAVITGAGASIVRAAVMQTLVLLAPLLRKEEDAPTSLGAAGLLLMLQNPYCILGWGMQLSFASMTGLILLSNRFCRFLHEHWPWKSRWKITKTIRYGIVSSLSATCAATICATPLLMAYFGMISLIAPLTNLLTVWVVNWCFRASLLTALMGIFVPPVGGFLGWCLAWGIRYVQAISDVLSKVPFASLDTETVYGFCWVLLVYCLIFLIWWNPGGRKRLVIPGCCVLVGLAGCLMFTILQSYGISMTVVDVGQGQCLMLSNGTQHVMIDCGGSDGESSGDLAAWELMKIGALRLDALILTHYDRDHCNGVPELLHRITVTAIFLPDMEPENELRCQIEETAEMMGIEVCYVNTKVSVSFGGGTVTLLPMLDDQMGDNIGLCAVCNMEKFQALVTGDLDVAMEQLLLEEYDIPAVDILVAGHHGSASSTSQALLEAVTPKVVVISVGENSYGHPAEETLQRIKTCGAAVYRTDLYGTLTLKGG